MRLRASREVLGDADVQLLRPQVNHAPPRPASTSGLGSSSSPSSSP
jgi:hypothetical protein